MKMRSIGTVMAIATAVAAGVQVAHGQQQLPPAQLGRWITESGNLEIDIAACGDALCGTVTRVMANRSMSAPGQEMEAVDKRPALGMQILTGLRSSGDEKLTGEIYNRENAKTYSVRLTMDGPQQMLVRPYVGIPLFGKTQLWQRVPAVSMGAEAKP